MNIYTFFLAALASVVSSTILQNGQVRITDYPDTAIASLASNSSWRTYSPNATELSYKGRWDAQHISCQSNDIFP